MYFQVSLSSLSQKISEVNEQSKMLDMFEAYIKFGALLTSNSYLMPIILY